MGMFNDNKADTTITSSSTWATSDEEKLEYHYNEAKRLIAKAEDSISTGTSSVAETYITMARMHLHVWADLKSIQTVGSIAPNFRREMVHSGQGNFTTP